MAEAIGVGESVTVEVTRANPISNLFNNPAPAVTTSAPAAASASSAAATSATQFPIEMVFIVIGVIVAAAFILLAFKKYRSGDLELPKRYTNIKFPDSRSISSEEFSLSLKNKWVRAFLFSFIVGFVGMVFSGTGIVWALAVVVFYYEFFVKGKRDS